MNGEKNPEITDDKVRKGDEKSEKCNTKYLIKNFGRKMEPP
jgi:hypothetical protein